MTGVERVPMVLCVTHPGAWREATLYRLRHRSPVSSALVLRSEKIKAFSRVVEAAQEDAGYKGAKAKKVRAAIMRACRDGALPVEAIERACETGLDETASRCLLVDAAKAMMASTATDAISGTDPLAELLGGHDGEDPGKIRGSGVLGQSWGDAHGGEDPGKIPGSTGKVLERGHNLSDDRMSQIVATIEGSTGKPLTISEIAYALSISNSRATAIRNITPKVKQNGGPARVRPNAARRRHIKRQMAARDGAACFYVSDVPTGTRLADLAAQVAAVVARLGLAEVAARAKRSDSDDGREHPPS